MISFGISVSQPQFQRPNTFEVKLLERKVIFDASEEDSELKSRALFPIISDADADDIDTICTAIKDVFASHNIEKKDDVYLHLIELIQNDELSSQIKARLKGILNDANAENVDGICDAFYAAIRSKSTQKHDLFLLHLDELSCDRELNSSLRKKLLSLKMVIGEEIAADRFDSEGGNSAEDSFRLKNDALVPFNEDAPELQTESIINTITHFFRASTNLKERGEVFIHLLKSSQIPKLPETITKKLRDLITSLDADFAFCQIDLENVDAKKLNLSNLDLSKANLRNANLSEAILKNTRLVSADLIGATLLKADLTEADVRRAALVGANLTNANLTRAQFVHSDLANAILTNAIMHYTNMSRAEIPSAIFSGADLYRTKFIEANLTNCVFTKVTINRTDFAQATLTGADLSTIDVNYVNLYKAKLTGSKISINTWSELERLKKIDRSKDILWSWF